MRSNKRITSVGAMESVRDAIIPSRTSFGIASDKRLPRLAQSIPRNQTSKDAHSETEGARRRHSEPKQMRIALLTGPSGSGKTFVADHLRAEVDSVSYDRLMRDSIERAFPDHHGDKWDKHVWLDNSDRLDLGAVFARAFTSSGKRPLLVEGWQLREQVWRRAILDLATSRAQAPIKPKLFVIQLTLELLVSERAQSKHEYHRRHADAADCRRQIEIHERLYREQPWDGDVSQLATKEEALEAVRVFLSTE